MKYGHIALIAAAAFSHSAKADMCGTMNSKLSGACGSAAENLYKPDYWQCQTGRLILGGICQYIKFQFSADKLEALQSACSSSNPQACADELNKDIPTILSEVKAGENAETSQLANQIAAEITRDVPKK